MKWLKRVALLFITLILLFVGFKFWQGQVAYNKIEKVMAEQNQATGIQSEKKDYLYKFDAYQKIIKYKDEPDVTYEVRAFSTPDIKQMIGIKSYNPTVYSEGYRGYTVQDKKDVKHSFRQKGNDD